MTTSAAPEPARTPPAVPGAGLRWALAPMVAYVFRACFPARRAVAALAVAGLAVVFGLLARTIDDSPARAFAEVAGVGLFGLVLPLTALVVGDAVLAAEVRSGALTVTWLAPVRLGAIVIARWLGGWLAAAALLAPATAVAAVVAGVPEAIGPLALAVSAGTGAYVAVFVAIGALTRRSTVWAIAVVILVERLLGAALAGIAQVSPTWLARGVYADLGPGALELSRDGVPEGAAAVVRLALVAAVALLVATRRLGRLRLDALRD